jgi:hypothetical protein
MSSTSEARPAPKSSRKPDGWFVARSVFAAGALLTAAWFLGLILLVRWAILAIF